MKKFFAAILTILYFATTTGATINMHYCMGKLIEEKLSFSEKILCGNCGMEKESGKKSGCCEDEVKFVKVDKAQVTSDVSFQFLKLVSQIIPVSYFEMPAIHLSSISEENPTNNAPPRSSIAIYKRNGVFRI